MASALRNLWESKVTALFTAVTLSVALGFLGAYLALFINMRAALGAMSEEFPLTVYISDGISPAGIDVVKDRLRTDPAISGFEFTSKDKALSEFVGEYKGEGNLVQSLGTNPLPASFDVKLKSAAAPDAGSRLAGELRKMPGVVEVQYLQDEAGRLRALLGSFRLGGMVLGLGVLLGVVFISYSTLRLAVLAHTDEINVLKLMGATRLFIMGPFLVEGVIQGLAAALLSLGILYGLLRLFTGASAMLAVSPSGLSFLPFWAWGGLLLAGGALGLTGSFFAFVRTLGMQERH